MAALTNAFLNILQSGDEIVSSAGFYGGSIDLFRDLETFGITTKMDRWLL
jgi:O-acetylhomoserine (thiol)-lyase